jgi:prepilin-type N-terminal cleavage/methylation domain-containing protein
MSTAERGFTLVELVVCAGLLALASAATVGAVAALAKNAAPQTARDVAMMAAENALVRARAAVAYASSPAQDPAALLADRSWGLVPGAVATVAGAQVRAPAACGRTTPQTLTMPVATTYDPATERFTVVVTYPRDPCRVAADGSIPAGDAASVTLGETLPPSVYPPGQELRRDVMPPARM